jgi:hypothetical protein
MNTTHAGTRRAVLRGAAAAGAAALAALGLASPASAYQEVPIFMNTCNSDNQSGDACVFTTVVPNKGGISVQFVSATDMCSDILAHVIAVDPQPHELGVDRVAPGRGGKQYGIPKPANGGGNSGISVHANGIEGGCNTGGLLQWGGKLIITNFGYGLPPAP